MFRPTGHSFIWQAYGALEPFAALFILAIETYHMGGDEIMKAPRCLEGHFMKPTRQIFMALAITTALVSAPQSFAKAAKPAPVADLVKAVDIPYESFKLDNGLTVVVHEDRKAPVVAVSVWYRVGSKHEPVGKTGFAHLFEHLMFQGSENAQTDFFEPLQQAGATDYNGTTNVDRTNYFQTVPTGALDFTLFLESDRMGHLLGAVTQEKLDNQRSVVQNEKRQGDNRPYGLLRYELFENLFPRGHPYRHSTIGSMDDLNSATMADVRGWFNDHYGPNNAVLVLAGDVDVTTAQQKVQKWFGDIKAGPAVKAPAKVVPTLPAPVNKIVTDMVPAETVFRAWPVAGMGDADATALSIGMQIFGGLASSRLSNDLVRRDPVAVETAAAYWQFEDAGIIFSQLVAKDGVDAAKLNERYDAVLAEYLANGPTQDELNRAVTSMAASGIMGLQQVGGFGGKATVLAEGQLYYGDAGQYKKEYAEMAALTPAAVKAALNKWLTRPAFTLTYKPGERTEGGENRGGAVIGAEASEKLGASMTYQPYTYISPEQAAVGAGASAANVSQGADRSKWPEVTDLQALQFPEIERGRLNNGVEVVFARRADLPVVYTRIVFDAGRAADPRSAIGTQSLMLHLMDEGTKKLPAIQFAEAQERLGATISGSASLDNTRFTLAAVKPNLAPSLDLLVDYIRHPAFDAGELERIRGNMLVGLRAELNNPNAAAARVLRPALYGAEHPYGGPPSGIGSEQSLRAISRDDVINFHSTWLRPDNARIFVAGDTSLAEVTRLLNASFGKWKAPRTPKPTKNFNVALPQQSGKILFVDRPNSPQSVILAGRPLDLVGKDKPEALDLADSVLGGHFLSRINMNLREDKGWSYGASSSFLMGKQQIGWVMSAGVQADKTGPAILEMQKELNGFLADAGTTPTELERTVTGSVRELPGQFEMTPAVLNAMENIYDYQLSDDYYEKLPQKYEAMTQVDLDQAARKYLKSDDLTFVVIGDAKTVKPQLEALDLPVETVSLSN